MNRKKKQSAIEKLLYDKAQLETLIKLREENLVRDFTHIRDNSSNLIITGFMSLLFPSDKAKTNQLSPEENARKTRSDKHPALFDYMAVGKEFMPIIWEIVKPFVLTWGINKAKDLIAGIFTKKKKR
jgi:hypothetical protein